MRRRAEGTFLATLTIAAMCPVLSGASRRTVWEVDLKKVLRDKGGSHTPELPVFALRFSPDGSRLAVIADEWWVSQAGEIAERYQLFVIQTQHHESDIPWVEVHGNYDDDSPYFGWTPSGNIVYANGTVLRVADAKTCTLPELSLFVRDDLAIASESERPGSREHPSGFKFFDAECRFKSDWVLNDEQMLNKGWAIDGVSGDRGLFVAVKGGDDFIADPFTRTIRSAQVPGAGSPAFADWGKAICTGTLPGRTAKAPVNCWEVDTGKPISEAPTVSGGAPLAAAAHSTRLVLSDYHRVFNFFFDDASPFSPVLYRRVVWDFRSNREILSWRPSYQWYKVTGINKPLRARDPFAFAISADGEYIAEGGSGIVRLYKIEDAPKR